MTRFFQTLLALGLLSLSVLWQGDCAVHAQTASAGVGFRNDLKIPVVVQGVSVVNNMQRRGQAILVNPGKTVWDSNLPAGLRFYTVYDASAQRILLRDQRIVVQASDQFFGIRLAVGSASQLKLEQEPIPKTDR